MALVRGTASGALDGDFGGEGSVLVPIRDGAIANDLVIDRSGKAIAIGQAAQGGGFVFALQADGRLVTGGLGCAGGGSGTTCRGGTAVLLLARQRAGSDTTPPVIEAAVPQRLRRPGSRRGCAW